METTREIRYLGIQRLILACALTVAASACGGQVQSRVAVNVDRDRDGVRDDQDRCDGEKEDGFPPDAKDGCASNDPDGDGILANADRCPYQAETKNGKDDEDGCPDAKSTLTKMPRVTVTKTSIKIDEKIMFAFGKSTIEAASDGLLAEIAAVITANPQIELIAVGGHADKIGNDALNVDLTKRRAAAVVDALVARGVERNRLRQQGYGRYCPIDPGDGEAAREKNRRVEFTILRTAGKDTGVDAGCTEAVAKGIKSGG